MPIFRIEAQEVIYYTFWIKAETEEDAKLVCYSIDDPDVLERSIDDSEGFEINKIDY